MSQYVDLDASERRIIEEIRTLKPFERIEIVADKEGKPATFLVTRTSKAILIVGAVQYTK